LSLISSHIHNLVHLEELVLNTDTEIEIGEI